MIGYERHYYELEGSKILSEIIFDINGNKSRLDYNYDINGELVSVEYLGYKYFYIKDALDNINYIVDETGSIMVKYSYDEWGVPTKTIVQPSCPIGVLNPFMYKSYYFDNDTEMYYLNSRFYHPSLRRFITMDDVNYLDKLNVSNLNLYNYSNNNPIMMVDPSGHFPWLVLAIISGVLIVGGATLGGVSAGVTGGDVGDIFADIGKGALNGLILSAGICLAVGGFSLGWSTIAGSHLLTYGVSISSNMLEVAVTQGKKSYYDGDGFWASVDDVNNAMFANSFSIVTGKFSEESITVYGTRLFTKGFKIFKFFETVAYSAQYVKFSNAFLT